MPANFSNLRLRYTHFREGQSDLEIVFNLNSLNFDINHTTIGASTPFTSEMTFELSILDRRENKFKNLNKLGSLLDAHFNRPGILLPEDPIGKITTVLKNEVFTNDNMVIHFQDINEVISFPLDISNPDDPNRNWFLSSSSSLQTLVTPLNSGEQELFSLIWLVKLKFHAASPTEASIVSGVRTDSPLDQSVVLFPELDFPKDDVLVPEESLDLAFNDELRVNYELTYLPESNNAAPMASPIGRAAEELSDSIANLASSLATNLTTTFKTQLQPVGSDFSTDVALWVMIRRGTDELKFTKYFDYMEEIFCGGNRNGSAASLLNSKNNALNNRRSLPFMNVDAYRAVKIASEAFVMVNCMVDRGFTEDDITDLKSRVNLVNGVPNEKQLDEYFEKYKETVNGGAGVKTIPYLAVIRKKLSDQDLKFTPFEDAFNEYLSPSSSDREADRCYGIIADKLTYPCYLELIWSYWHEESMMVQGLNAICRRFQNIRGPGINDPLSNLEIDPLRSLNNLMWGYIQDEQHRLTVRRRAYEYDHHYGITLKGDATKDMRFADSRSKFIEAFHTLLNLASRMYKQSDDMTVKPDGFPLLNGLRETHLILSEGAHNQYGDLPSVARAEMLMQQWLLARPELRQFLPSRNMVAYPESWMDSTSSLNNMMSWTKTSVLHFNYLAIYGEKILLGIRFGNWADQSTKSDAAVNWATFWRPEIQGYIHAYRAVTGIDLSAEGIAAGQKVDVAQPSVHLFQRLKEQQNGSAKIPVASRGK
ncbi:MAG: hypothetical protein ACKV1O_10150 [Saprospiraceae bacterium]